MVKKLLHYRLSQTLDIHCAAACKMLDRTCKLRRTVDILAAYHCLVLVTQRFRAADGTYVWDKVRLGTVTVGNAAHYLRDYVPRLAHDYPIADADILVGYHVLIMQYRT